MGKTLETLKRRDPAHGVPGELVRREPEESSPELVVAPASVATAGVAVPFIEVGAGSPCDNLPGEEVTTARMARATVSIPDAAVDSGTEAAGLIQFRPQPKITSAPIADPVGGAVVAPALHPLVVQSQPGSAEAQSYRLAAEALAAEIAELGTNTVWLCPVGVSEHLLAGAVNLALALAEGGRRRTLLVDAGEPACSPDSADTPSPATLASLLRRNPAPGWRELMAGMSLALVTQATGWYRLHLIARGAPLAASRQEVDGARIASILLEFRRRYDLAIFLAPRWTTQSLLPLHHQGLDAACLITCPHAGGPPPDPEIHRWIRHAEVCLLGTLALRH